MEFFSNLSAIDCLSMFFGALVLMFSVIVMWPSGGDIGSTKKKTNGRGWGGLDDWVE